MKTKRFKKTAMYISKQGLKYDDEKIRTDLLPVGPLLEVAKVYTFGAGKYTDNNWRLGLKWSRVYGAILRHIFDWFIGKDKDAESGLSPLAHAAWGCLTLLEYEKTHKELDDRIKGNGAA